MFWVRDLKVGYVKGKEQLYRGRKRKFWNFYEQREQEGELKKIYLKSKFWNLDFNFECGYYRRIIINYCKEMIIVFRKINCYQFIKKTVFRDNYILIVLFDYLNGQ